MQQKKGFISLAENQLKLQPLPNRLFAKTYAFLPLVDKPYQRI